MNPLIDFSQLAHDIKRWGRDLGFQETGITDTDLSREESRLLEWLDRGYHGGMDYMARHGVKRARPDELIPGTLRIVSARLNYKPRAARESWTVIGDPQRAFISRYALGRDYHKVLRNKLQALAEKIEAAIGAYRYRVFTDSAPVLEVALARNAGLGWRGKHTLLLTREAGSMFFLGEIYTDLPLPADTPTGEHCGTCRKCLDVCPTQAIVAPYQLDARRCISYLTIEHKGPIPESLRPLIGNRVYGCDDCQLVCPWNKYAQDAGEDDFQVRNGLDNATLVELFGWTEPEFEDRLAGSAIRRIGYRQWLRNIAVGLGNALADSSLPATARKAALLALQAKQNHPDELIRSHVHWALRQTLVL